MSEIRIEVPLVPPSANHYKKVQVMFTRERKPYLHWFHTKEAEAWWAAVAAKAAGRKLQSKSYEVFFLVYTQGLRQLDTDNACKCVLDSLTKAGVIPDDRYVDDIHGSRRLDRMNPRTIILVKAAQEQIFGGEE